MSPAPIVATTASSVWARWSTTSATVQPSAADGDSHASGRSSFRMFSRRSCSATRSSKTSIGRARMCGRAATSALRRARRHALRAHDLAQLLHRTAEPVHLVLERADRVGHVVDVGAGPTGRGALGLLQLLVARAKQAGAVALLGDIAAEQLAGADVDRVVPEEAVEDVGLVAGVEPVQLQGLHLLEVRAIRGDDRHRLAELPVVVVAQLVSQLVDALGEAGRVLALACRDR